MVPEIEGALAEVAKPGASTASAFASEWGFGAKAAEDGVAETGCDEAVSAELTACFGASATGTGTEAGAAT